MRFFLKTFPVVITLLAVFGLILSGILFIRFRGKGFHSSEETVAEFSKEEQSLLIHLARDTVESFVRFRSLPRVDENEFSERLREKRACFVTLNRVDEGLRGCMGYLSPVLPLYQCVMDRAVAAATQDPRFFPVRPEELEKIEIEVSVLSIPQEFPYKSPEELLEKLKPGVDGVILKTRYGSSTFLPQVWEQLPQPEVFLTHLCRKHGAPSSCWRERDSRVFIYRAIVIAEEGVVSH